MTIGSRLDRRFWLVSEDGVKLYPVRIRNRLTGRSAFRICPASTNITSEQIEVDNIDEVERAVVVEGHGIRVAPNEDAAANVRALGGRIQGVGYVADWSGPRHARAERETAAEEG
ncbi:hypothetical protein [Prosthecomicrobium sp. N25]|uniref:hypothetical protein n=1 Tax=Prosthecomicrobium sp. N25 TaxID=3129254 RepID=UPI0030786A6E